MNHPKHPMASSIPKIDPTDDTVDDAPPASPAAGNDTPPDDVHRKRTHRGGKSKRRKAKTATERNDQLGDRELAAIPEDEEGEVINTGKSKPTEGSTGEQSTGQSAKGRTIGSERRWSAGDLDERENCEKTLKIRGLVKKVWEALDELLRMSEEEVVPKKGDGRFIFGV